MSRLSFQFFYGRNNSTSRRLLRDLVALVLLISGLILGAGIVLGLYASKEISSKLVHQFTEHISQDFISLLQPVRLELLIARQREIYQGVDIGDQVQLNNQFMPVLEHTPGVSGIVIASSSGIEYYLRREKDFWLTRAVSPGADAVWRRWDSPEGMLEKWTESINYDPVMRPWFKGAVKEKEGRIFWTRPYLFFTDQIPGITGAISWWDGAKEQATVVAFDLRLDDLLKNLSAMAQKEQGRVFIVDRTGSVFLPNAVEGGEFVSVGKTPGGVIAFDAADAWIKHGRVGKTPLSFFSSGKAWWAEFLPFYKCNQEIWFEITIPSPNLLSAVGNRWPLAVMISFLVLVVGIQLAVMLVSKYSRLIKNMPTLTIDPAHFQEDLMALIRGGESATLEFKSTMRMNLRTGKFGKEIELAWLKAVVGMMNTEGGIVLLGVGDNGEVLGIDPDGFENEDKCRLHFKNIFKQHIGMEFSNFVHMELWEIDGKTLVTVECERSDTPVFLLAGKEETYYIRSGPSSMKLTTSQALKFLNRRY